MQIDVDFTWSSIEGEACVYIGIYIYIYIGIQQRRVYTVHADK